MKIGKATQKPAAPAKTKTEECIDCGKSSASILCKECFELRSKCKNPVCSTRLNKNTEFEYCIRCKCIKYACNQLRCEKMTTCLEHSKCEDCFKKLETANSKYCNDCISAWNAEKNLCILCPPNEKKETLIHEYLCQACSSKIDECSNSSCNEKVYVEQMRQEQEVTIYKYCIHCLCSRNGCSNQKDGLYAYCKDCLPQTICGKNGFRVCKREKQQGKKFCDECCAGQKCTNRKSEKGSFCRYCSQHYSEDGGTICKAVDCFKYTQGEDRSLCFACYILGKLPNFFKKKPSDVSTPAKTSQQVFF